MSDKDTTPTQAFLLTVITILLVALLIKEANTAHTTTAQEESLKKICAENPEIISVIQNGRDVWCASVQNTTSTIQREILTRDCE